MIGRKMMNNEVLGMQKTDWPYIGEAEWNL